MIIDEVSKETLLYFPAEAGSPSAASLARTPKKFDLKIACKLLSPLFSDEFLEVFLLLLLPRIVQNSCVADPCECDL